MASTEEEHWSVRMRRIQQQHKEEVEGMVASPESNSIVNVEVLDELKLLREQVKEMMENMATMQKLIQT